jgi:hypothetical protein
MNKFTRSILKKITLLLLFCTFPCFAQSVCPSVWVYHQLNKCKVGPDMALNDGPPEEKWEYTNPMGSGHDGGQECAKYVEAQNQKLEPLGISVAYVGINPNKEDVQVPHDRIGIPGSPSYRYFCGMQLQRHPLTKVADISCGAGEQLSQQNGGPVPSDAFEPLCVTCDDTKLLASKSRDAIAKCLMKSLKTVVNANPSIVTLHAEEYQKIGEKIQQLIAVNKNFPIPTLAEPDVQDLFTDYLNSNKR